MACNISIPVRDRFVYLHMNPSVISYPIRFPELPNRRPISCQSTLDKTIKGLLNTDGSSDLVFHHPLMLIIKPLLFPSRLPRRRITRLQVLAVVGGDGDGGSRGRGGSSGGGSGDAPARAGLGVLANVGAGSGVGGDVGRDLGGSAVLKTGGALELGGLASLDGDGDSGGDSVGDDGGQLEAGAVGLAGLDGQETSTGTGDGTLAVVAGAGTLLENGGHGGGNKGENNGSLHLE
jgi:hypothetical protein